MALESGDLYLVSRAGTDYRVEYGTIKEDILGSVDLDGGAAPTIAAVLAEGNTANPAQSLHFKLAEGDIPPISREGEEIEVEGQSGLRLGGLVSHWHMNSEFQYQTSDGETIGLQSAMRRMTAVDDWYVCTGSKRGDMEASIGATGIKFNSFIGGENGDGNINFDVSTGEISISAIGENGSRILEIFYDQFEKKSTITATEFIGDGSKLTNLPASPAVIDWDNLPVLS